MATDKPTRTGAKQDANDDRSDRKAQQAVTEQRQDDAMQRHRADPSEEEKQVRREQGGHDRPVGADHVPHPRPRPTSKDRK